MVHCSFGSAVGQTAADICVTYDGALINQYIDMGGLLQLDDIIAEVINIRYDLCVLV